MESIVMYSGGLDSSVVLAEALKSGKTKALFFDFGQPAADYQIASARRVSSKLGAELEVVDISGLRRSFLGLSPDALIGLGFRESAANCPHALFGLAATYTQLAGASTLITGINATDLKTAPRAHEYIEKLAQLTSDIQGKTINITAPLVGMEKSQVISKAVELAVPLEETRSCISGSEYHCGICSECNERREAFKKAKVNDPTKYLQ